MSINPVKTSMTHSNVLSSTDLVTEPHRYQNFPRALTIYYEEHQKAFHVLKKGHPISTLMPDDRMSMKTFRNILEVLDGEEEFE